MSTFFKVILRNLLMGPATIKYPFEDSPAPEKLRGKIKHNPDICMACRMCEYVCAGGAIRLQESEDKKGLNFIVWHNSCTFCGLCEHYCPTKAIHLTNDYHTAHLQKDKFNYYEETFMKYQKCVRCGKSMIPLSPQNEEKIYGKNGDVKGLSKMCPECRREAAWEGVFKREK